MEVETAGTQLPKDPEVSQPLTSQPEKKAQAENKDVYSVEKIIAKKIINGQKLYLIKWEGYPTSKSTWEPVENLLNVIDMIVDYEVRESLQTNNQDEDEKGSENSPKKEVKRKAERSLSEEDLIKKVKGENGKESHAKAVRKASRESVEDDDDDDEEEESMKDKLNRRKKQMRKMKAFQGKEFSDRETFASVASKVNMAQPFVVETVELKDEESESDDEDEVEVEVPKRGRGRPRKTDRDDGHVKKKGRPLKNAEENGDTQPKKRGRPRKNQTEEEGEHKEIKTTAVVEKEAPVVKKRGRPRKTLTSMFDKEDEDAKSPVQVKEKRKRGRPRKDAQENKSIEEENSEDEDVSEEEKEEKDEKEKEKKRAEEPKEKMDEEDGDKEKEGKDKKEEEEGASPTALVNARKEAVMKRRGLAVKTSGPVGTVEEKGEEVKSGTEVVKRGRGRPRKVREVTEETEEEKDKEKEKEKTKEDKGEQKKENENLEDNEEEEDGNEGDDEDEESEEEEEVKPRNPTGRKRGRPRKSERGGGQPGQRKRGRPRKDARPAPAPVEEKSEESNEGVGEEGTTEVRKRGRPRKVVPDPNKENFYQTLFTKEDNKGNASGVLGVRSTSQRKTEDSDEAEKKQMQAAMAHKFGSLNEKDIPKRIVKARMVTDKGCIFLIEWEKRADGEQPQNSHVTSHELKNFDPTFLLEYYEEIVKKNLKNKITAPKVESIKRDEDMIPVEQNPEQFGSFAFHDNPKEIVKVKSVDQDGWEFLVRWEPRSNNVQPLDSVVNNEALKLHDPNFLISFYESKIRAKPGEEAVIALDILDQAGDKEQEGKGVGEGQGDKPVAAEGTGN